MLTRQQRCAAVFGFAATLALAGSPAWGQSAADITQIITSLAPIDGQVDASATVPADVDGTTIYLLPEASVDIEVYFARNSTALDARARSELAALGQALASPELAPFRYLIAGHTDASGAAAFNQQLSEKRAESVRLFLIEGFVIDPARLESVGWGESRLKDPDTPRAAINRRVEITLIVPPEGYAVPEAEGAEPANAMPPAPANDESGDVMLPQPAPQTEDLPGTLKTDDEGNITIVF